MKVFSFLTSNLMAGIALILVVNQPSAASETRESLGEKFFNDKSLSKDGTQSCASCHDSQYAFTDHRTNKTSADSKIAGAVSTGQDDKSLGDINAPSATYAAFVPDFHSDKKEKLYKGGLFLNGRSKNLVEQAQQPFLNPGEMQTTKEEVVAKVKGKYAKAMQSLYGKAIFNNVDNAFTAIAKSITAFERTEKFSSFDSKFDKVLKGQASFTAQELRGRNLFDDEKKGNCAACHPVPTIENNKTESLFTDFTYDNLGAPKNNKVRSLNGKGSQFVDNGLLDNPKVKDKKLKGAFRVPSLRNVAVTAPYLHNGVFKNLETVVHFYNTRDVKGSINPETQKLWEKAEVNTGKNTDELGDLGLSDKEIKDIVAFMKTLTDERYEHLIPKN